MQMDGKIHICCSSSFWFAYCKIPVKKVILLIDHMSLLSKWQEKGNRNPYQEYLIEDFSERFEVDLSCNDIVIPHDVISPIINE